MSSTMETGDVVTSPANMPSRLEDLVDTYFPEPNESHYRAHPALVLLGSLTILFFGFPGALFAYSSDSLAVLACSASSVVFGAACIVGSRVLRGRAFAKDQKDYAHRRAELLAGRVESFEILPGPTPMLSVTLGGGDGFLLTVPSDACLDVRRAFWALDVGAADGGSGANPELEDVAELYLRNQSQRDALVAGGFKRVEIVEMNVGGVSGGRTVRVTLGDDSWVDLAVAPHDLDRVHHVLVSHRTA